MEKAFKTRAKALKYMNKRVAEGAHSLNIFNRKKVSWRSEEKRAKIKKPYVVHTYI